MKKYISRRDFLKLAGGFPLFIAAPGLVNSLSSTQQPASAKNVIVIVFDAFTARNISLYGYQRKTTPNLARLADRAIVYHNHYAGGNFTSPGTASLLTGTLPWTHRAFRHWGKVEETFIKENIFSAFDTYYRLAYSHNPMANGILGQFTESLEDYIPRDKLFVKNDILIPEFFKNDEDIASVSWMRAMKGATDEVEEAYSYSLFLSHLLDAYENLQDRKLEALQPDFPLGLPTILTDNNFTLEDAVEWFGNTLPSLPKPFMSYLHFMPPHAPYRTHREFYRQFKDDGFVTLPKPLDIFSPDADRDFNLMQKRRTLYDEFILYVDREFNRFFENLEKSGLLDETWVILTSDHGEMFERGIIGHSTPVLYNPVIRIPLLIFEPGRKTREDVFVKTSAIDVLPTLLHVTDRQEAHWAEGVVLPPFSNAYPSERNIYTLQARTNAKHDPLTVATTALIKGQYKLTYYFGYEELGAGEERVELFDIENDPEEMNDLSMSKRETRDELLNELRIKLAEVDRPFL